MTHKIIDVSFPRYTQDFKYIIHIADLHFRNVKRNKEYKLITDKFLSEISKYPKKETIIYIGGDLAHSKLDMSPELVRDVSSFLDKCGNLFPTVYILGNHDLNLNNPYRLDVLSPIDDMLKKYNKNTLYMKENAIYRINNIDFITWPIQEDQSNYINPSSYTADNQIKAVCWHGALNQSKTDINYEIVSTITSRNFDGAHIGLLGDIHKRQTIQDDFHKCIIHYPGSLTQQNFGETLNHHGYSVWDLSNKQDLFPVSYDIKNDFGMVTIELSEDDVVDWEALDMPLYPKIRIKGKDLSSSYINKIKEEIHQKWNTKEFRIINERTQNEDGMLSGEVGKFNKEKLSNSDYQLHLIKKYISKNFPNIDKEIFSKLESIHNNISNEIIKQEVELLPNWSLNYLEFDNMFSYGEGNRINFKEEIEGIVGLFSKNAQGKSSLVDVICVGLFDTCDRANKPFDFTNIDKDGYELKLSFFIHDVEYIIERKYRKSYNKNTVNFYRIHPDGSLESLNGEERKSTNRNIAKYVGTFDDFVLTSLSGQGNDNNFIEKKQSKRQEVIVNLIGIDILDKLNRAAKENLKILRSDLRSLDINSYTHPTIIEETIHEIDEALASKEKVLRERKENQNQISSEIKRNLSLKHVIGDVDTNYTEEEIAQEIKNLSGQIEGFERQLSSDSGIMYKISDNQQKAQDIENKLNNDYHYDDKSIELYYDLDKERNLLLNKMHILGEKIKNDKRSLSKLEQHKYDPECQYCINNVFVKDALKAKTNLEEKRKELQNDMLSLENIENKQSEVRSHIDIKKEADVLSKEHNNLLKDIQQLISMRDKINNKIQNNNFKVSKLENILSGLKTYKEQINHNKQIDSNLKELEKIYINNENNIDKETNEINDYKLERNRLIYEKEQSTNIHKKHEEKQIELESFRIYAEVTKSDGLPLEIIKEVIPMINNEANDILEQIADFNVSLEIDDKDIMAYIVRQDNNNNEKKWALELASGMEKFFSGLAIRIAITKVSQNRSSSFMIIDEGWGSLDSDSILQVQNLFDYLKDSFDFSLIISHVDTMKDMVDTTISIIKHNGSSYINV